MASGKPSVMRKTVRAGLGLLAGGVCLAALPSALAAVTGNTDRAASLRDVSVAAFGSLGSFTPASVDPKLMDSLRRMAGSHSSESGALFRFTPATAAKSGKRAVTVAVRVNSDTANLISAHKAAEAGRGVAGVDPVAFNLGLARGYQSFAQSSSTGVKAGTARLTLPSEIGKIDAPDLRTFTPAKSASSNSRFGTIVELDDSSALPGRDPRTLAGAGEMSVDVAGSYRVARNLKVTAGIRYSSERDRLTALTDDAQDNQSVYVGTQFRF